jgi:uncharacterized protein (DUF427 family)
MSQPHPHHITTEAVSERVRIVLDGVEVADSVRAVVLREGSLPPRYYFPLTDVRADLLEASSTTSHCPFKGDASYWSVAGHEDLVWTYVDPLPERSDIAGLVAFFNERVEIVVG